MGSMSNGSMQHDEIAYGARRPVLYVEDHPVNVILMEALFERRPALRLVVATSVAEALVVARDLDPVLLLLDLHLPDGHGSDLLPQLRRIPGCADAPAVAVTADNMFDVTGTGFCELWPKPMNLGHVLERIDRLTSETPALAAAMPPVMPAATLFARWG